MDRPGQLNLDLKAPNLFFDMLHEHPRRNYNSPHLTANKNNAKIQASIKLVMQGAFQSHKKSII